MSSGQAVPPPRTIQFKCVKCGQPIRVNHPTAPVRVACPKCELPFAILPDGQIIRQDTTDAFDNLPPAVVAQVAPPRAKGFRADVPPPSPTGTASSASAGNASTGKASANSGGQVYRPINPPMRGKSRSNFVLVKRILGWSVATCFACLIGGGIWYALTRYDAEDAIHRVMASVEKPEGLWNEVIENGQSSVDALNGLLADEELDREAHRTRVIDQWDRSREGLRSLRKRATYLQPMSKQRLDQCLEQIRPAMETMTVDLAIPAITTSLSSDAGQSWDQYRREFMITIRRVANLSSPLPEGDGLKAQVARQAAEIERALLVKAARMDPMAARGGKADREPLAESITEAVQAYYKLSEQLDGRLDADPIADDRETMELISRLNYRNLFPVTNDGSMEIERDLQEARADVLGQRLVARPPANF